MNATLKNISLKAGVSIATASHILGNRGVLYAASTRQKVLAVAKELDYSANLLARGLRGVPTKQIGLIVSSFFPETYLLEEFAASFGYSVQIMAHHSDRKLFEGIVKKCIMCGFDGMVIRRPVKVQKSWLPKIPDKFPVVVLAEDPFAEYDTFIVPREESAKLATEYLIGLGHKKIGFIYAPSASVSVSNSRYYGYERAMKAHGLGSFACEIHLSDKGDSMERGYFAFKQFLSESEKSKIPTGFVTSTDEVALGVMVAAEEYGLNIPGDISIVGQLNCNVARFGRVPLTTVDCNYFGMEIEVMERLMRRIENPEMPVEYFRKSPRMVIRESCRKIDLENNI